MDKVKYRKRIKGFFLNKTLAAGIAILVISVFCAFFSQAQERSQIKTQADMTPAEKVSENTVKNTTVSPAQVAAADAAFSYDNSKQAGEELNHKEESKKEEEQSNLISLGEYKITFYCSCVKCCGKSDGITATGTVATAGKTIAVDPKVIALGSKVLIDGDEYIAEDTGGFKGQTIDMFVDSHQDALNRGVIRREVFIIESKFK